MSKKSTPEFVDGLADRREQRDTMGRRNARGLLRRMVASLLEEDVVLGLLAAIGNCSAGRSQFGLSAIDEPRSRRVHALQTGEIEGYAFCAFGQGEERSPRLLQLMSRANDPFARQREHDAVLGVLTSYGRRCGHQALRPSPNRAHIAPPRDCRAHATKFPNRIRAKTNQVRIGDHGTRTQIRKQSESNFLPGWRRGARDYCFGL